MTAESRLRRHGGSVTRPRQRLATTVFTLVAALTATLLPLVATAASAQAPPPTKSAPTPPAEGLLPPDTTPPTDHPVPTVAVPESDPAMVLPARPAVTGSPGQELVALRTATSKTFVGASAGERRTEVYTAPVHFKDAKGDWVDINTDLGPSMDGRRHQVSNSLDVSVADSATDASLVNVGLDATHSVGFALGGAAKTTGKADSKSITYAKVGKDTDLKVTSRRTGVKDELVLASAAAPDRFVFPLQLKGLTASIDPNGDVVYRDEAGVERARTPHGFMTDAKLDASSGEAPMSTGVTYALIPWGKGGNGVALEVRLDRAWLNDPARQYPVTVDPQIANAASADDTYVMSGFYRDNSYDAELKVGTYDGGAHIGRTFMHFDTSALNGASVTHAEIHLAERWSWNCSNQPEPVWRVSAGWNGRAIPDWSNQPPTDPNPIVGGVFANVGCSNRLAVWDVTSTAAGWAANPGSNYGLSLRATNESDNNRWKKYASTEDGAPPALIVDYNHTPIVPVSVSPANLAHVIGSTTTLSATYADADGGSGYVAFGVWNASNQMIWSQWSAPVCTWCATSVSVPAMADGWYYVQTAGYDGQGLSAFSSPQWYFLDTVPPPPPTAITPGPGAYVGSPTTVSARYSEPYGWSGQVLFDLISSTGGQGPAVWSAMTCNGCIATATLPAAPPGVYTLYVLASDGAWSSWAPTQTLTIGTAPPAPTGLQAVAGALSALLSWTAPASNGGPIGSYTLTATDTAGGPPIQTTCTGCTSPFTIGGLTAGHNYTFTAQATNAVGTGPTSAPASGSGQILPVSVLLPTQVTAGYYNDGQINVTWQEAAIHVPLITRYAARAYLAPPPTNGGPPSAGTPIAGSIEVSSPSSNAVIGGLTNGATYYVTVEALTLPNLVSSGQSPASNTITVAGRPSAPAAPSVSSGDTVAIVNWNAPIDHGNSIKDYTVRVFSSATQQIVLTQQTGSSPVTFSGLLNGTSYYVTVVARNDVGASPDSPASAAFTPAGRPFRPTMVTAVAGSRKATVSWQAADGNGAFVTGYKITPSTACPSCSGVTVPGNATSSTVIGLHPGDAYFFTVVASNHVGDSEPSAASELVTPPPEVPGAPNNVRATAGDSAVSVAWDQSDTNGSTISRYTVTASPGGATATSPGGGTATVGGLTNGTPYTFRVVATNGVGDGAPSQPSSPATPSGRPSAPINVSVLYGDGQATVAWAPADTNGSPATRYAVTATPPANVGAVTVGGTATSAVVGGIDNNTFYAFNVVATNANGDGVPATTPSNSLRAIADQYLLFDFLDQFMAAKQQAPTPFNWTDDGCSFIKYVVPQDEVWFHDACTRHDFGYRNYGNGLRLQRDNGTKQQIDNQLLDDMHWICGNRLPVIDYPSCMVRAQYIYEGVNDFGGSAFYG